MKSEGSCDRASRASSDFMSNALTGDLKEHVAKCADCSETVKVAAFLRAAAHQTPKPIEMPSPGLIWWKAVKRRKQTAAENAGKPIVLAKTFAVTGAVAIFVWMFLTDAAGVGSASERSASALISNLGPLSGGMFVFAVVCALLVLILKRAMPYK